MVVRKQTIVVFVILAFVTMWSEWRFARALGRVDAVREYHGLGNAGVGHPYQEFIKYLRTLYDSGKTKELGIALHKADNNSHVIFDVWLAPDVEAYKNSVYKIMDSGSVLLPIQTNGFAIEQSAFVVKTNGNR
jgi:hypothetical protein